MVVIRIGRKRKQAGLADRLMGRQIALALGGDGEVDHHDAVLLDDADQQDDADQRDHRQVVMERHQDQQRADAGRRQGRQDGQRLDVALIQHAQDDVDGDQRRRDQEGWWPARPGTPAPCPGRR